MLKKETWLLLVQILLSVLLILYLIGRSKGLPSALFWPIAILLVLSCFFIVRSSMPRYQFTSICLLSIVISLIPLSVVPDPFNVGVDGVFEAQFASIIATEGKLDPTMGTGFAQNYYGHNPVLHLILAFSSLTSGISTYVLLKYFFFVFIRFCMVLFAFAIIWTIIEKGRGIASQKDLAFFSLLIFVASAGMAFVSVTRRSIASLFLMLCILTMLRANDEQKGIWNILFMIFAFMVIVSNHSISFYLFFFLVGAWLFSLTFRLARPQMRLFRGIGYKVLGVLTMLLVWEILLAEVFVREDILYFNQLMSTIVGGEGISSLLKLGSASGVSFYHTYETAIIYGAQLLFLLIGALGFFWYAKRFFGRKEGMSNTPYFFLYLGIFGFIMYVISALFMTTGNDTAVIIILWMFCLPISIFAAYFMLNFKSRSGLYVPLCALFILVLFMGSFLMGINTPRITNRAPQEDVIVEIDSRAITEEIYAGGKWVSEHGKANARVLGDFTIFGIFSGFFFLDVNSDRDYLSIVYRGNQSDIGWLASHRVEFGSYPHTHQYAAVDYFVLNRAFERHASAGFRVPITIDTKNLDEYPRLNRVYTNDELMIYGISRG